MLKKVLLVEDNPEYALALGIRLKSAGYSLFLASTMSSAMSKLVSRKPVVSLIDINLPDGNGFTLASQIQNNPNTPKTPIIFITGNLTPHYLESAQEFSPIAFLEKPFETRKLIDAIEYSHYSSIDFRAHYKAQCA